MNYSEIRKMSLEFRRLSSNMLNSNTDNADINLSRFLKFINESEFIITIIKQKISGVEYDFKNCFRIDIGGWADFNFPADEAQHIKAQYDYLTFIDESKKINVENQALRYCWSDRKINIMIQKFMDKAFKPLIDFVNDQISMEMIIMDEERKANAGNTFIQNIETLNGSATQQANGTINNYNNNNDASAMLSLIEKIMSSLPELSDIDVDEIDNVKDDLEVIQEQISQSVPKKNRLTKALNGVKKFANDFSVKLAVSLATGAVTNTDWGALINQIEMFIENLPL